ncbi:unnamed protein product [Mesocestoides corti]|uniref:Uncharacterized protein n=1 Tax=Mesocestoides corti TaxID=53468 RepID=A0A0R3UPE4_MESCO|nr:unnamed protein product [Mesocestoides corti]
MPDSRHIGDYSLTEGKELGVVTASCDRGRDFLLRGVPRGLNDAPKTEGQSASEFWVSVTEPRNGPTGEEDDQVKDTQKPCFPRKADQIVTCFSLY